MKSRVLEIQEAMQTQGMDVLLLFRPDELVMAFGYLPFLGTSIGIILPQGRPLLLVPGNEPPLQVAETVEVLRYSNGMHNLSIWDDVFKNIEKKLKEAENPIDILGVVTRRGSAAPTGLGAEGAPLPEDFFERIQALASTIKNASSFVYGFYNRKTRRDIEGLKRCYQTAALGIDAFYENVQEGNKEVDVKIAIESAIAQGINAPDITYAIGWAQVQAGLNSMEAGNYNRTTSNQLKNGDLVMLELAVGVDGYWCDLSRTGCVGEVSAQTATYYSYVEEAQRAAIEKVRHGVACKEVYGAAMAVFEKYGIAHLFPHALGHGVGFRYHDPAPNITSHSEELLQTGMVITIEPGIYGEEISGGIRIEDNLLVTEDGAVVLSNMVRSGLKGENLDGLFSFR